MKRIVVALMGVSLFAPTALAKHVHHSRGYYASSVPNNPAPSVARPLPSSPRVRRDPKGVRVNPDEVRPPPAPSWHRNRAISGTHTKFRSSVRVVGCATPGTAEQPARLAGDFAHAVGRSRHDRGCRDRDASKGLPRAEIAATRPLVSRQLVWSACCKLEVPLSEVRTSWPPMFLAMVEPDVCDRHHGGSEPDQRQPGVPNR